MPSDGAKLIKTGTKNVRDRSIFQIKPPHMDICMPWDGGVGLGCHLGVCWAVNHSKMIKIMQKRCKNANSGVTEVQKLMRKVLYIGQKLKLGALFWIFC